MTDRFLAAMNKKKYNGMITSFRFIEKSLNIDIQFKNTTILRFPKFFLETCLQKNIIIKVTKRYMY